MKFNKMKRRLHFVQLFLYKSIFVGFRVDFDEKHPMILTVGMIVASLSFHYLLHSYTHAKFLITNKILY